MADIQENIDQQQSWCESMYISITEISVLDLLTVLILLPVQ